MIFQSFGEPPTRRDKLIAMRAAAEPHQNLSMDIAFTIFLHGIPKENHKGSYTARKLRY